MSLGMVAAQLAIAETPIMAAAHKWQVLRNLCECKGRLGLSERSLTVLSALLTFHPETALTADVGSGLVVFPSNRQLSLRANGMAAATLRRHLAILVDAGVIVRRDSPNGKRYARRGADREVEVAYGFDLGPLVARAAEFEAMADVVRVERRELAAQREALTILRRDVAKMIATGMEEDGGPRWASIHETYVEVLRRLPRNPSLAEVKAVTADLLLMVRDLITALEKLLDPSILSATESQNERHKQNSKPELIIEFEPAFDEGEAARGQPSPLGPETSWTPFPLGMVLSACPDIASYARGGARSWPDVVAAADLVRSILGVSPSAWREAVDAMGPQNAATAVAVILQKGEAVRSAGGYLRALVEKARVGSFSLGPPLMALLRVKGDADRREGQDAARRSSSVAPPSGSVTTRVRVEQAGLGAFARG